MSDRILNRPLRIAVCGAFALAMAGLQPGATAQTAAQQADNAQPALQLHDQTQEVLLPVVVLDKHGALVTSLQKSDLTLSEDGRPQVISSLESGASRPLQLGLLVDTTRAMLNSLESERKAADKFVDLMLPAGTENHEAFLIHFDREVELLQDFSALPAPLHKELEGMGPTARSRDDKQGPETMGDDRQRPSGNWGGRQLYDAIYLAADELMKPKSGLKALVVFSNGVDRGSKVTLNEAIDAAERAHCVVYTIYLKGEEERDDAFPGLSRRGGLGGGWPGGRYPGGYPGGPPSGGDKQARLDGKNILEQVAKRTGGRYLVAKKKDQLDEIYGEIAEDLRAQYVLAYTPDKPDDTGGFHKIELKANNGDRLVLAPEGYYAKGGDSK